MKIVKPVSHAIGSEELGQARAPQHDAAHDLDEVLRRDQRT